jgi:hypothetical protein
VSPTLSGSRHTGQRVPLDSGAQGLSGPGSGQSGNSIGAPSGGESFGSWLASDILGDLGSGFNNSSPDDQGGVQYSPVGAIIQGIYDLISFFDWLFGGSDNPPIPRQLRHGRHPLYAGIIGIRTG